MSWKDLTNMEEKITFNKSKRQNVNKKFGLLIIERTQ